MHERGPPLIPRERGWRAHYAQARRSRSGSPRAACRFSTSMARRISASRPWALRLRSRWAPSAAILLMAVSTRLCAWEQTARSPPACRFVSPGSTNREASGIAQEGDPPPYFLSTSREEWEKRRPGEVSTLPQLLPPRVRVCCGLAPVDDAADLTMGPVEKGALVG